ncbi:MAG TPA: DMT family transporter [Lachnospiraceae bacterium]|nr:DMT family transporter [Lachnospiraceae bacterium]
MKKASYIFILLAGILWGTMGFWVRKLNGHGLVSMDIVFLRSAVTACIMLVVLIVRGKSLLKIKLRDLWCFAGTGLCSIVFFNFCYFKAIMLTTLSVAAILLYTAPAFVIVLSFILFHERITLVRFAALVLMFSGCCFVTGIASADNRISFAGLLYGLGAGLGYALYSIFGRFAIKRGYDSMTITFYTFLAAAAGSFALSNHTTVVKYIFAAPADTAFSFCFAAVCTVVPYLLYTWGLKSVENGKAAIIASIEPVTAALLGILFYHESVTAVSVIGFVMVLAALLLCSYVKH